MTAKHIGLILMAPTIGIFLTAIIFTLIDRWSGKKTSNGTMQGGCLIITLFVAGLLLVWLG